jgi:hypothetical protein
MHEKLFRVNDGCDSGLSSSVAVTEKASISRLFLSGKSSTHNCLSCVPVYISQCSGIFIGICVPMTQVRWSLFLIGELSSIAIKYYTTIKPLILSLVLYGR